MSKHTPGPWEIIHRDKPRRGEFNWWILGREEDIGGVRIAEVIREDNARLIAAAPDLVDVAHMVLTTATVYTPPELVKAATEALRKAGEI